ncbi:MAG: LysR family transcriptional regulator [Devosia sp.]|uniref:LysR family transcriptional regulator n=1 Tax=Devosia sp. TaxID=1871048 RepID=UPI00261AB21C|nr:LysR family transcriptional regulator [Devosia sp.]MDB5528327.1 LysR family transcriptional regulator [Devosia sp.]
MSKVHSADWERQRAFLAVMREGSLSGAARVLNVAQPTVRRRIEDLELDHGVALFTRAPSGLIPTAIAHELAAHAQAMSNAADSFVRAASAEAGSASGTVRITASEVIGVEVLPPLLAELRGTHPGLVIELGLSNRSEDLLGREADIAVRNFRPVQDALVAKRIGAIDLGLHAHRSFLDRHGTPTRLQDLANFALIGFEHATIGVRALQAMGLTLEREDFAFRTDSDLGQLAAIRASIGIGICQIGIAKRDPDLIHLLPGQFAFPLETWVVTHEDLRHVQRVRLVYDALVEGLTAYAA